MEYEIQNKKLKMKKLTTGALINFYDFIADFKEAENKDDIKKVILLSIGKVADAIFPNQGADEIKWEDVEAEKVVKIVEDFFLENTSLIKGLTGLANNISKELQA